MPKKGLNIHKRKDKRWEGRYCKGRDSQRKILYGYVYGKTYKEAKEKLILSAVAIQKESCNETNNSKIKRLTMSELLCRWLDNHVVNRKGATIAKYQFLIDKHLVPDLGRLEISALKSDMINSYLSEKMKSGSLKKTGGLSPSYVRTIAIVLNSAIKFAQEEGLLDSLKVKVQKPSLVKKELTVMGRLQQAKVEEYILSHLCPTNIGVLLSMHTGLRIGEICALRWEDIDMELQILHVRHTIARVCVPGGDGEKTALIIDTPKTKTSARDIPISSFLMPVLRAAKDESRSQYVVSGGGNFISPRTYSYRFQKLLAMCSVEKINYHTLRHTFATRCIEVGVDIKSLSEILGHANVSVTLNTYVHSSMQLKRQQLEKLSSSVKVVSKSSHTI